MNEQDPHREVIFASLPPALHMLTDPIYDDEELEKIEKLAHRSQTAA
jgi:hypothetical protein